MSSTQGQTSPPIPTRSPIADSTGLVTRTWINWFTFLNDLFISAVSPALSGVPTAPTAAPGTNNTQIASTAYADAGITVEAMRAEAAESLLQVAISSETTRAEAAEALLAPLASPHLTGVPTVPTAAPGTSTTQVASSAFVGSAVAVETARATAAEALKAPLASPTFTGTATAATLVVNQNLLVTGTTGTYSFANSLSFMGGYVDIVGPNAATEGTLVFRGITLNITGGYSVYLTLSPGAAAFTGTVTQPTPSIVTAATTASSATAGAASALPSAPLGYLEMSVNGVTVKVPYYSV